MIDPPSLVLVALAASKVASATPPRASPPAPAPAIYATEIYDITFRSPPGSYHCPLPRDWAGSDHGTIVFLTPPKSCGGAGYSSSGRGFAPAVTPRIAIYYGYWMGEDEPRRPACHVLGHTRFLGRARPVCRVRGGALIGVEIQARYKADSDAQATLSLVTTKARFRRDLATLEALARSARTCSSEWRDDKGAIKTSGAGAPCPANGQRY